MTNTKRAARTDTHRPSAIVPADYACLVNYSLATQESGWPVPPINMEMVISAQAAARERGARIFGSPGSCGVCGARFKYGDLWLHEPTGEIVHLGHDCADKYGMVADRQAFERALDAARVRSAREHVAEAKRERREAFLSGVEGLAAALECDHYIVQDLGRKLAQYGSLSDAQVALALKIAREALEKASRPIEVMVAAPQGKRITFRGTVVGYKVMESAYGATVKITVKVETDAGAWLVWGTMPSGIHDAAWSDAETAAFRAAGGHPGGTTGDRIRGRQVEITATLKPGREAHFAVMDRPKGTLLPRTAAEAGDGVVEAVQVST